MFTLNGLKFTLTIIIYLKYKIRPYWDIGKGRRMYGLIETIEIENKIKYSLETRS